MISDEKLQNLKMVCVSQKFMHRWDSLDGNAVTPVEVLQLISDVLKWRAEADIREEQSAQYFKELQQWKGGIKVDKCNRCGGPPPLMLFQYYNHAGSDTSFAFCKKCYAPVVRGDYDEQKRLADETKLETMKSRGIGIVEAGVDPKHQTDHCDDCGKKFKPPELEDQDDMVKTCSATEYLTLCRPCYRKRANSVR